MAITNGLKISQLDTATEFQDTDFFAVSRGIKTYKLQGNSIINKITSTQRYEGTVPVSTNRNINIVHNLNTINVNVNVYENATNQIVYPTVAIVSASTVRLTFRTLPTTNQYRVLITK
jgi:hypothetical protein